MNIELRQTCGACPEQYDAYLDDNLVGYLRLRHGYFRAEFRGEVVFEGTPRGDGCFESEERESWLNRAKMAILACILKERMSVDSVDDDAMTNSEWSQIFSTMANNIPDFEDEEYPDEKLKAYRRMLAKILARIDR